jgi:uncharacterized membrane protein (UPF0127 family)
MKHVQIYNLTRPELPPIEAVYCQSFFCQLRGLMFRRAIQPGEGLLLVQPRDGIISASIHMLFMRFAIGVIWINNDRVVVDVRLARPWRLMYKPARAARYVLETHPERMKDFRIGEKVEIRI